MKKHIITIAGRPGSGKSTTAKGVAAKLGYEHFSSGDLFRAIGQEMGIELLQTNLTAEKRPEIDRRVDQRLREIGEKGDRRVIDSRMAWHWIPNSYKVFLDLDLLVAAERIISGMREAKQTNETIPQDPSEYAKVLEQRRESESRRYMALYQADPFNTGNYDVVVDTAANDIEHVVGLVVSGFRAWLDA